MAKEKPRGASITNEHGRIIVIGDPHGCYDECIDLLDKVQATSKDTIVFAGDLVDRGPHNDKVMDLAMQHEAVLGNHEDRHCRYVKQELRGEILDPKNMPPTHVHTRSQLRPEHYDYMRSLPHFIRFPQYNHALVHGGVWPGLALEDQPIELMIRMQYINPEKSPKTFWAYKRPVNSKENELEVTVDESYTFWHHWWKGPERIIFGHSVLNKPLITPQAVGIDGGCVFGLQLWAFILPDNIIVSVPSRQERGPQPKLHYVDEGVGTY